MDEQPSYRWVMCPRPDLEERTLLPGSAQTPRGWHTVEGTVNTRRTSQKASIPAKTWMYPYKWGAIHPTNIFNVYLHRADI